MIQCPKCSADNSDDSRFCSSCGGELTSISQAPTVAAPEGEVPPSPVDAPHVGRIVSSDSVPAGGFTPGTILADRYRIIGLLGRGGMGEVYRADDLKLGQPVALKFLPPKLADDAVRRERFFAEVRITRQLSHPNICRVYDIGEVDGRHFLSMEYIDGEDLASLMKRIGHLSNEKALDIARQLVAGLSVAHERGVLHRDLKPANIMLDGHGRVRITDFGLAIAAEDEAQAEEIAGTPAYMAPEQLAGKGATVRSDIYSLGLILYEIYTGKKAFKAKTLAELREQKETQTPRAPSELRDGIDPVVERVIQRCMEKDPNARPASVAQLAQALPGGDPLAAAIAAGETPSPEMVAASGSKEGLRPVVALSLLAFIITGMISIIAMNDRISQYWQLHFEKKPEELVERSHEILKKIGYTEEFPDSAHGFTINSDLLDFVEKSGKKPDKWKNLDAKGVLFWYRQSPRSLGIQELTHGSTSSDNPPLQYQGEILLKLDTAGRLVSLQTVPQPEQSSPETVTEPDWEALFSEAGLDISQWNGVDPKLMPPSFADSRVAWEGQLFLLTSVPIRIEAAALHGKPVSFMISGPWLQANQMDPPQSAMRKGFVGTVFIVIVGIVLISGIFFARKNLRLGRGDRHSANRLTIFSLCAFLVIWALGLPWNSYISVLLTLYWSLLMWIYYIAMEPFARRWWPKILVSWTRLLSGKWQDPLVARDLLIGVTLGVALRVLISGIRLCCTFFFQSLESPHFLSLDPRFNFLKLENVIGVQHVIITLLEHLNRQIFLDLAMTIWLLVILKFLLRSQKIAIVLSILVVTMAAGDEGFAFGLIFAVLLFFTLMRFGFLAVLLYGYVNAIIENIPMTLHFSAWYSGYGYLALALLAIMVLYAFRTSLGGRTLIDHSRFNE